MTMADELGAVRADVDSAIRRLRAVHEHRKTSWTHEALLDLLEAAANLDREAALQGAQNGGQ